MKKFLNTLTLKWKIFAFLLSFCAILLIILWLFQTVFLDSFYRSIKVMEIKNNADIIVDNIDSEMLQDLINSLSQNGETSIEIFSNSGTDIYSSEDSVSNIFRKISTSEKLLLVVAADEQGGEYINYKAADYTPPPDADSGFSDKTRFVNTPRMLSIIYVQLVTTASGEDVAILMNSQISPVNATVTTLRYQLYLITAIMILLAVILALIIARRVSKPLEEINKSAKELALGHYDIRFGGAGFREIVELSDTLNTAAADLSKVERLRRELMANISHDLRTPLALIYSYAEVMHDFPDEISGNQTQIIMDEAHRMSTLVNDVLDISRLESGNQELKITEYNLTHSIAATTSRVAELLKNDDYSVTFESEGQAIVSADETKITQAYYNLMINAVNYTGADKRIVVRQVLSDGFVRIEVTDTGNGIEPEDLSHIWDRYYRVEKKHKRAVTGTGLGLSIVNKVINMHGGSCGVESSVGKGSTFWFSLKTMRVNNL